MYTIMYRSVANHICTRNCWEKSTRVQTYVVILTWCAQPQLATGTIRLVDTHKLSILCPYDDEPMHMTNGEEEYEKGL